MNLIKRIFFFAAFVFTFTVGFGKSTSEGNEINTAIFDKINIQFNPGKIHDGYNELDGIIRLSNGRIAIKKVSIPIFKRNTTASAIITLTSNGDRWDKSGSCFIIPKESAINMINIAKSEKNYPAVDSARYEKLPGIVPGIDYKPTIEIMRFMTPFGVGYYSGSNDSVSKKRMPVYIDGWAKDVVWKQDISDLMSRLMGEVYIGVYIDTWTEKGYNVSLQLNFKESKIRQDKMPKRHLEPLINTVFYTGQSIPDIFARKSVSVPFSIPKNAKNVRLKYIVTGHGGHERGDEFVPNENILSVDGNVVYRFTPWRTDCASFRRFNPSTGVWLQKRTVAYITNDNKRAEKEIEEPIGSSDLSRSNWCPGSDVPPVAILLNNISAGNHTFNIAIPKAQASVGDELNHWLVSAYLIWDES
ncbi:MAG: PNGase F N-terminal domain-containing protein [Paludibacteraceae bacterium]